MPMEGTLRFLIRVEDRIIEYIKRLLKMIGNTIIYIVSYGLWMVQKLPNNFIVATFFLPGKQIISQSRSFNVHIGKFITILNVSTSKSDF